MTQTVLITGGTGMIGKRLTQLLQEKGYEVAYLSRKQESIPNVKVYRWDVEKNWIDEKALVNADYIIHLAGAGIADGRWTDKRKQEIIHSRTSTIELIARELQGRPYKVKAFVSASAIGFYGADTGDKRLTEQNSSGSDFLAHVTRHWENSSELISHEGTRTTKLRIGVVLSSTGGALPQIMLPIRWGIGAPLASGTQWVSWIHLDDLCRLFITALENEKWHGVYNAVAPSPVTNEELTRQIADVLHRPLWMPNIPGLALRLLYGEMANVVLGGNYVVNQRIKNETDFQYQFDTIHQALADIAEK
ncbi:TIGR01777 family oxidoreductase [Runella sp.]|uniref:TIGR01777 family oxidoreductase n=1 Tax=Runella sp. TaxID=1960881 RepID=UPI00301694DB